MRKLHDKFIKNSTRIYLLIACAWLGMTTTSCTTYVYYSPGGGTFKGADTICIGAAASPDTFTYTQCKTGDNTGFFVVPQAPAGNVQWYYNTTGSNVPARSIPYGASVSFTAPADGSNGIITYTPLTTTLGTYYYFADMTWTGPSYCNIEYITPVQAITIDTGGYHTITGNPEVCMGDSTTFSDASPGGTWSSVNSTVATVNASGVITPISPGTANINYSVGTCVFSNPINVNPLPLQPVITPSVTGVCNGSNFAITSGIPLNFVPITNSFEDNVPGLGWSELGPNTSYLFQQTAAGSSNPTIGTAEDGTYFMDWDSYDAAAGDNAAIYSPPFSLSGGITGINVTFWVWREYGSGYTFTNGYGTEGFTVYIDTVPAIGGALLGFVPRDASTPTFGVTGASTTTTSGWYKYNCTVPASYTGSTNYILFNCNSDFGHNCYLDNISITETAPTWSPTNYLFSDAGLTTPYTAGTPLDTVYMYPTGVTPISETYTATATTAAGCFSQNTSNVTIYNPTATISGDTSICSGDSAKVTFVGPAGVIVSYNINGGATRTVVIGPHDTTIISTGILYSSATYNLIGAVAGPCSAPLKSSRAVVVTVSPPADIVGDFVVCVNAAITLTCSPTGGTWSSGSTGIATINAATGTLTGLSAGTSSISYTAPVTGCLSTAIVTVDSLPIAFNMLGGGTVCSDSLGVDIGLSGSSIGIEYQLYDNGSLIGIPLTGTGSALNFGLQAPAGTYTVLATNINTGCINNMSGSAVIVVHPSPVVYKVTGGGSYCAEDAGVVIGLNGSNTNISYQLYYGSSPIGSAITGSTGFPINFGFYTLAGTYTVAATDLTTSCKSNMDSSATIFINPRPTVYTLTGGGTACGSDGAGFDISLSGSDIGIKYLLYNNGTAVGSSVAGTGSSIDFGNHIPVGIYTAVATNTVTGCTSNMSDNAVITINPFPNNYNVTGGGAYCRGGTGVPIGLTNSDTGVNYQLFKGLTFETMVAGTGSAISFGPQTAAGTYTVLATDATTNCASKMPDSAVVIIYISINDAVSISPGPIDSVCAGTTVTYTATSIGAGPSASYQWSVNNLPVNNSGTTYTYTPADGDVVKCTMTSTYSACAIPALPSYSTLMTVQPRGVPSIYISPAPEFLVCEGSPVVFTPTPVFGGYNPVYTWFINGVIEGTGSTYTFYPLNHDTVSCILSSNYECRLTDSAYSNKKVETVIPLVVPVVHVMAVPTDVITLGNADTLIALVTNGGTNPTYQWYIDNAIVPGATSDTFISHNFINNDSVSCQVTSGGTCAGVEAFSWIIVNAFPAAVQQLGIGSSDIRLLPNPNKGSFTIKGIWDIADDENVSIEITDILGQVIYKNTAKTQQGQMNVPISLGNTLANGVYLLNLRRGDESKIFHFVIEQ